MAKSGNCSENRLVFLSRRAFETGQIRLVLRTADVWDKRDTGWELLSGKETGLELVDPGNSLLVSVSRAVALDERLASLLLPDTPPESAAYRLDAQAGQFKAAEIPTAYREELGLDR